MIVSRCLLTLYDFVYYATREMGRLYETGKYLHNYGLAFALGLAKAPYASLQQTPTYAAHLAPLNEAGIYVTPARPIAHDFLFHTFKLASVPYYSITPQTTVNKVLYGRAKELAPNSVFEFYVISTKPYKPPTWIRLGKWMSKAALKVDKTEEVDQIRQGDYASAFPMNPLDLPPETRLRTYDLISMPPVSLLDHAQLTGPHYTLADGRCLPAGLAYRFGG
jgi:CRISPR-associated protein Csc1